MCLLYYNLLVCACAKIPEQNYGTSYARTRVMHCRSQSGTISHSAGPFPPQMQQKVDLEALLHTMVSMHKR